VRRQDHAGRLHGRGDDALGGLIRCSYAAYPNVEPLARQHEGAEGWAKVH